MVRAFKNKRRWPCNSNLSPQSLPQQGGGLCLDLTLRIKARAKAKVPRALRALRAPKERLGGWWRLGAAESGMSARSDFVTPIIAQ